jgi:hypothetical protein
MKIRKKLRPPEVSKERLQAVERKIREIEAVPQSEGNADELIEAFNRFTGRSYEEYTFRNY